MPASNSPPVAESERGDDDIASEGSTDELTVTEPTIIHGNIAATAPAPAPEPGSEPDVLESILRAGQKLPGQLYGAPVDIANLIGGGYANIVDMLRGQTITRNIGEGLVPRPVGGSDYINTDILGLPASSGTKEDIASLAGGFIGSNPLTAIKGAAGLSKALIVAAGITKSPEDIALAQKMLAGGATPSKVFENLGIYEGPLDGKLRSVISDSQSQINPAVLDPLNTSGGHTITRAAPTALDEVLGHPALFEAYPELKDVVVIGNPYIGVGNARAYTGGKTAGRIEVGPMKSVDDLHSAILHETQHFIQDTEGFMGGGSFGQFLPGGETKFNASLSRIQEIAGEIKSNLSSKIGVSEETIAGWGANPETAPAGVRSLDDFQTYVKTRAAQATAFAAKRNAHFSYEMIAGEAEARSVQKQFDLNRNGRPDDVFYPPDLYSTQNGLAIKTSDLIPAPTKNEFMKVKKP